MKGKQMTGPDLHIAEPLKQNGGGVLPAEYYGGNSGRYFEEGSPELLNCETAYGRVIPRSHGVVMDAPNGNWMGPNLASFPNATPLQTGGCGNVPKNVVKKEPKEEEVMAWVVDVVPRILGNQVKKVEIVKVKIQIKKVKKVRGKNQRGINF